MPYHREEISYGMGYMLFAVIFMLAQGLCPRSGSLNARVACR